MSKSKFSPVEVQDWLLSEQRISIPVLHFAFQVDRLDPADSKLDLSGKTKRESISSMCLHAAFTLADPESARNCLT